MEICIHSLKRDSRTYSTVVYNSFKNYNYCLIKLPMCVNVQIFLKKLTKLRTLIYICKGKVCVFLYYSANVLPNTFFFFLNLSN